MNLLGFPNTTGSLPEAVLTAATMEPVPEGWSIRLVGKFWDLQQNTPGMISSVPDIGNCSSVFVPTIVSGQSTEVQS